MRTAIRGMLATIALGTAVVLAPIALIVTGSYPVLGAWLHPSDPRLILIALTMLGWGAWGVFIAATITELVGQVTGQHREIPGFGGLQRMIGLMLVMILALVASPKTSESSATASAAPISHPTPAVAADAVPPQTSVPIDPDSAASPTYTTMPGDDLWTLSERLLGDGRNWRQLTELNPALSDPLVHLQPGTVLRLPHGANSLSAPPTKKPSSTTDRTITVHKGDTLSELAEKHLGKTSQWPKIARANAIISDPDHIEAGWKLRIPQAKSSPHHVTSPQSPAPQAPGASPSVSSPPSVAPPAATDPASHPTPRSAANPEIPDSPVSPSAESGHPVLPLTVGTLAASALVGALELRRSLRQRTREMGTQEAAASEAADRVRTLLRATAEPEIGAALDAALRAIGSHCHRHSLPLPVLAEARVRDERIDFFWAEPAHDPPPGFTGDTQHWIANGCLPTDRAQPCPYPALVSLGTSADGEAILIDVEHSAVLGVSGSDEQRHGALAAMAVELACAPWSAETQLVVVGDDTTLIERAGEDRVQVTSLIEAENRMIRDVARRREQLEHVDLATVRTDPDRADAVAPIIFCILTEVPESRIAAFDQLLADQPTGIALILPTESTLEAQWHISGDPQRPAGWLTGRPGELAAHFINADTRRALGELLTEPSLIPASWAQRSNVHQLPTRVEDPLDIVRLHQPLKAPHLELIGPAELHDAAGPEPTRSRQQLIELAAWILEHPGSTATQMSAGLVLADSTRRSNLSRLRAWLGDDPHGQPYLPDGYSGRISLHSEITSDWQQLQGLLAEGITQTSDGALTRALELVRGAPLADAAPSQWIWAEELRVNISEALRDVGLVLTERALAVHNIDLARWAASRALVVAPEDELLMCARLRTEYRAGNNVEAARLVTQLTRQARVLGVDLLPETVELCQQVIEGRIRARA